MDTTSATSGLTWLTGPADGDPVELPCPVVEVLAEVVGEMGELAARAGLVGPAVDLAEVLTGRAGLLGTHRQGPLSVGGSCRLLPVGAGSAAGERGGSGGVAGGSAVGGSGVGWLAGGAVPGGGAIGAGSGDGSMEGPWVAVSLARESDRASVGALVGRTVPADIDADHAWELIAQHLAHRCTTAPARATGSSDRTTPAPVGPPGSPRAVAAELLAQARLLGMPVALLPDVAPWSRPEPAPYRLHRWGERSPRGHRRPPLVVDLSSLWAGPLCTRILADAGCRVVKVESEHRLDGARSGPPAFYDWLHAGQESVVLDFTSPSGREALRRLIESADVVVEASRPRALAQLGVDAAAVVARRPGVTWLRITGYGDEAPDAVAFGDDAAVAAGLVARDRFGAPVFVGDAIADPITGLVAAHGVLTSLAEGGGTAVDVAMVRATRFAASRPWPRSEAPAGAGPAVEARPPAPVHPVGVAPRAGSDTAAVLATLAGGSGSSPC